MARNHFAQYMLSPKFNEDQKARQKHKDVCQRCKDGIIKFTLKKILGRIKK